MSAKEIQTLKRKFIFTAMVSMFLAMTFVGAMMNVVTFLMTKAKINKNLNYIAKYQGEITDVEYSQDSFSLEEIFSLDYQHSDYYYFLFNQSGEIVCKKGKENEQRYEEYAVMMAGKALAKKSEYGEVGTFSYKKGETEDGLTMVVLLDSEDIFLTRYRMIWISVAIGAAGMLLAGILIISVSDKMIQPEIENSIRQDQFITNASHELKTPLAVIRSNTEMIEILDGESEWTQSTIRQVDRMTGLIRNLVMITRSREKENARGAEMVDISKAVTESVQEFEGLAAQEELILEKEIEPGLSLLAQESEIRQLVTILVDNAIKYCDEKGIIRVSLKPDRRKGLRLTVANSYRAGEHVDYRKFFDRFYREDAAHNIDKGGYGIGLSIAESLCESYGGSIEADWKDGMICFICRLSPGKL